MHRVSCFMDQSYYSSVYKFYAIDDLKVGNMSGIKMVSPPHSEKESNLYYCLVKVAQHGV